jgi:NAD(P)-dependent dehydrogenase (short-subunit alcohol dehydrogenase family)
LTQINFAVKDAGGERGGGVVGLSSATVLVTGAANGIGRALAAGFLADGAQVLAVDRDESGLDSLAAAGARIAVCDVADAADLERVVAAAASVDVLVNNAGIAVEQTIEAHGEGDFERVIAVNLVAPFHALRLVLPGMRRQGFGRVINVISRNAEYNPSGLSSYSASKAALWSLTRTAANETRDVDILVNALIPGPTKTGMNPNGTQEPEAVYPTARALATLPAGGPSGRCYWNLEEYRIFQRDKPNAAA